jgi:hypothetical protein
MQFQLLPDQVQASAQVERPALPVAGHEVPAVHVGYVQAAGDSQVVERSGDVNARGEHAVNAGVLTAPERGDFAEVGALDGEVQIGAPGIGVPAALQAEGAEALCGKVGARGLALQGNLPIAAAGGRDVQVGFREIKNVLGIAEFEVDAAVAHVNRGGGAHDRGIDQRREVPAAPLLRRPRLHKVNAGFVK